MIDQGQPIPTGVYHVSRTLDIWRDTTMTDVTLLVPSELQQIFGIASDRAVSLVIKGDLAIQRLVAT